MKRGLSYKVIRVFLGLVYVVSGVAKLLSPTGVVSLISTILGCPKAFSITLAYSISSFEIVIGLSLIVNWLVAVAAFISALFLVSSILIGLQFVNEPIECGCFGSIVATKTDWLFFSRNIILLCSSMFVMGASPSVKDGRYAQ